jgi:hypothetical protein
MSDEVKTINEYSTQKKLQQDIFQAWLKGATCEEQANQRGLDFHRVSWYVMEEKAWLEALCIEFEEENDVEVI